MATTLTAVQTSATTALLTWVTDETPVGNWVISRDVNGGGFTDVGQVIVGQTEFLSSYDPPAIGDFVSYRERIHRPRSLR